MQIGMTAVESNPGTGTAAAEFPLIDETELQRKVQGRLRRHRYDLHMVALIICKK